MIKIISTPSFAPLSYSLLWHPSHSQSLVGSPLLSRSITSSLFSYRILGLPSLPVSRRILRSGAGVSLYLRLRHILLPDALSLFCTPFLLLEAGLSLVGDLLLLAMLLLGDLLLLLYSDSLIERFLLSVLTWGLPLWPCPFLESSLLSLL